MIFTCLVHVPHVETHVHSWRDARVRSALSPCKAVALFSPGLHSHALLTLASRQSAVSPRKPGAGCHGHSLRWKSLRTSPLLNTPTRRALWVIRQLSSLTFANPTSSHPFREQGTDMQGSLQMPARSCRHGAKAFLWFGFTPWGICELQPSRGANRSDRTALTRAGGCGGEGSLGNLVLIIRPYWIHPHLAEGPPSLCALWGFPGETRLA